MTGKRNFRIQGQHTSEKCANQWGKLKKHPSKIIPCNPRATLDFFNENILGILLSVDNTGAIDHLSTHILTQNHCSSSLQVMPA